MAEKHYLQSELEDLLQSGPDMWEFLQKGSWDGCWYWDLERPENEWMSEEFWRLFGVDPATKRHDPGEWQDLIFPEDGAVALQNFKRHCEDPNHAYDQIVRYLHTDGSTDWVRCRGIAIRDEQGRPVRMLGAHTDLTAVKRAEQAAQADRRAAEIANDDLRTFAYAVSHELKSPSNTLSVLLSEIQDTQGDKLDAEGAEFLGMATETVQRMLSLIEGLLGYTRMVGNAQNKATVDLNAVLDGLLQDLRAEISESNAQILIGPLPEVQGIELQLRILFQNLLQNAMKFRRADVSPKIEIQNTTPTGAEAVSITVKDNGIGLPEDSKDKIFDLFKRLHNREAYAGSGLGLSVCRRVAHNHGGDVVAASSEGQGSAFTVTLART